MLYFIPLPLHQPCVTLPGAFSRDPHDEQQDFVLKFQEYGGPSRRKPWQSTIARKMRFLRTTAIGFALGARDACGLGQACDRAVPSDSIHLTLLGHSQMLLINSVGMPSLPTRAPTIPPTIAAVVSASPPHTMASVTAF
jgi:hypothetical protein